MDLKDKLEKLNESNNAKQIDWNKNREEWINASDEVLNKTKEWFRSYIELNLFRIIETQKTITEEYLGTYSCKQLEYEFSNFRLVFEPMGRNILGAKGRIDVYLRGRKTNKYILVLLETSPDESKWFLSSFNDKSVRIEFNKINIEKVIEGWIDQNTI